MFRPVNSHFQVHSAVCQSRCTPLHTALTAHNPTIRISKNSCTNSFAVLRHFKFVLILTIGTFFLKRLVLMMLTDARDRNVAECCQHQHTCPWMVSVSKAAVSRQFVCLLVCLFVCLFQTSSLFFTFPSRRTKAL